MSYRTQVHTGMAPNSAVRKAHKISISFSALFVSVTLFLALPAQAAPSICENFSLSAQQGAIDFVHAKAAGKANQSTFAYMNRNLSPMKLVDISGDTTPPKTTRGAMALIIYGSFGYEMARLQATRGETIDAAAILQIKLLAHAICERAHEQGTSDTMMGAVAIMKVD